MIRIASKNDMRKYMGDPEMPKPRGDEQSLARRAQLTEMCFDFLAEEMGSTPDRPRYIDDPTVLIEQLAETLRVFYRHHSPDLSTAEALRHNVYVLLRRLLSHHPDFQREAMAHWNRRWAMFF